MSLQEIKEMVAKELNNNQVIRSLESSLIIEKFVNEVAKRYAFECCKELSSDENKVSNAVKLLTSIDFVVLCPEDHKENSKLSALVLALEEYNALLLNEIESMVTLAHVHGWRSKNHEAGKLLRDKIDKLK